MKRIWNKVIIMLLTVAFFFHTLVSLDSLDLQSKVSQVVHCKAKTYIIIITIIYIDLDMYTHTYTWVYSCYSSTLKALKVPL